MTKLANLSTTDAARNRNALVMTCDVPVVRGRRGGTTAPAKPTCRPTGRSPQGRSNALRQEPVAPAQPRPWRSAVRTQGPLRSNEKPVRATATSRVAARQLWAAALLTGLVLAALVFVIGMVGADYQDAARDVPVQTEIVHVQSGESLSALAGRIAPNHSAAAVIATVRELNGLQSTGLRPGQALVVPAYR